MAAPDLSGRQRKLLRGMAHGLQPVVHVGQGGVSDAVVRAVDRALLEHELVKIRMHEPDDKKGWAAALAQATESRLCGLVGHTVILYRQHPEDPKIDIGSPACSE